MKWTIEKSLKTYGVDIWGAGFFTLNQKGHIEITPQGIRGPHLDLYKIITDLSRQNVRLPVLMRFPDIIHSQMHKLVTCFDKAINEYGYKGQYQGVFPVKVNQQSAVIKDIVKHGEPYRFGLEVGSKPELLIALSLLNTPERIIVANGFKDGEYIKTALLSLKAGMRIFIVVERLEELSVILKIAKNLKVKPAIGFRIKLHTQAQGQWAESSGFKSKFGLTNSEIMRALEILKENKALESLKLLHFHIGSQVPSIQPIKSAIRESARIMIELFRAGARIQYMDVGGGLGVDYDGSGLSPSSTNYSVQEYVNDIVYHLQTVCDETNCPHPHIISESGRFLVAHSSLLVFNVISANSRDFLPEDKKPQIEIKANTHAFVKDLYDIYKGLEKNPLTESFNDLVEKKKDIHQLFIYGVLSLKEAAMAENIYCMSAVRLKQLSAGQEDYEEIFQALTEELSDIYFSNFSVFQSLPDSWALNYIFPVMPIHRLNKEPVRRVSLADLTCDSDGKVAGFMNYHSWKREKYIPAHTLKKGQPYYMAVFLTGAYQEILGDMHNLFGDTDALHVSISKNGNYSIEHYMEGDSIYNMLKYVGYHKRELMERLVQKTEQAVLSGKLSRSSAGRLLKHFTQALSDYTYLKGEL